MSATPVLEGYCQRWDRRRPSWRHASEGGFRASRYRVVPLAEAPAKAFVTVHHYSKAWPSAKLRYGIVEGDDLVGVAVLGVPMSQRVLTKPFPTLKPNRQSMELSRLVLLDQVPANAETWFLARMFRLAAEEGVRGIVAFSDPMPRIVGGRILMPGHLGDVYKAFARSVYTGRATKRTLSMLPDGTVLTARSAAKVTGWERGAGGVVARLEDLGAPRFDPAGWMTPTAWLSHALDRIAVRVRHRGNHRYAWTIGDRATRRRTPIALQERPRPQEIDPAARIPESLAHQLRPEQLALIARDPWAAVLEGALL
ncbi:hypothetical protein KBX50_08385 [Micromonospora sp. C51]|uniref:Mom family adenine methylcarbamoylation protein n=1 Tax=Micromonospora sp. C51 TaxID=2824879 RepID=UPI001B395870|nr:hypothetical protein [Micromonospora sp. C51]MBQ1048480.1 hypothetical protein [Micromonospora sp. C51]